ncbi:MAG: transglutaminase domain-containing protein [Lachnospiraceae bacterium]|nr:transglutaminase domain-containing protein [Lachnospiraceae bacterium]
MEQYLKQTDMLNFHEKEIQQLIHLRKWKELDEFHKIKEIYQFVQNEIVFGYNCCDTLNATQVLADGYGQCNTKATLLMALLRGVGIPCRLHGFEVSKNFQRGVTSALISLLAPKTIVHTWAEVYYQEKWIVLEGVITDQAYLSALKKTYGEVTGEFRKYAVATKNLKELSVEWKGEHTFVQSQAIVCDYGIFQSPDEFFQQHGQHFHWINRFLYTHFGRKIMTRNVDKVRRRNVGSKKKKAGK